tara:strand:- start:3183 stop:4229 length:1047 start_codon:yes stop_codon:yes gene_type:complete
MYLKIGKKTISEKNKPFVIAEIGVNHNGRYSIAKKLIDKAISCGADCVKFQTFSAKTVATKKTMLASYQKKNKVKENNQFDMLKKLELTKNEFRKLFNYCKKKKIEFLSTPVSFEDVDFLNNLGVKAFKLSSMHASEPEFIKYVASKKKPIFASTGMCTIDEVKNMVKIFKRIRNNKICLLQCTSSYPSKIEESNINVLKEYKKFKYVLGYSDHTLKDISAVTALALGARVFEKHFTLNKKMNGPDHRASLDPIGLKKYIEKIRLAEKSLGSSLKKPTNEEENTRIIARRSLSLAKNIKKGEKIKLKHIKFIRPATGIKVKYLRSVLNKKVKKNLKINEFIQWSHLIV